jgi:hypothetical protein
LNVTASDENSKQEKIDNKLGEITMIKEINDILVTKESRNKHAKSQINFEFTAICYQELKQFSYELSRKRGRNKIDFVQEQCISKI